MLQVIGQSPSTRVSRRQRPCLTRVAAFTLMASLVGMLGMTPVRATGDTDTEAEALVDGDADVYGPLISQLPQLEPGRFAGQFSSRDRSGGNSDWSDEKANRLGYLYRDSYGHRVLAEVKGEGAITRLWFTGIDRVGNIRIYIDNDTTPTYDLPVRELFAGTHPPFVRPWVVDDSRSSGGFVSYVRIPFRHSFKVTTTGEPSYYHVGYEIIAPSATTALPTTAPPTTAGSAATTANTAVTGVVPTSADRSTRTTTGELLIPPGGTAYLSEVPGPAAITRLVFTLPDVLVVPPPVTRRVHDNGRAFTGYSEFTVKIDPDNQGVRLIRRLDYGIANQTAQVYVDGELVDDWSTPGSAVGYNWLDATFDIPAGYTRGKSSLRIRVEFISSQIDWNEFYYWVYIRPGANGSAAARTGTSDTVTVTVAGQPVLQDEQGDLLILTDSIDVGYGPSEVSHDYQIVDAKWFGDRDFEYAPAGNKETEARQAASLQTLRQLWLEASWDGQPVAAVQAPLSLFFATPIGPHPVDSALIQVAATGAGAQLTSLWPMPFSRSAKLRLQNAGSTAVRVQFTIISESRPELPELFAQGRVGYFHATYRREHPTTNGRDYTILQVGGVGKLVGVSMRLAGPPSRWYLEGDERIRVDGSSTSVIYGTGTEDHFGGGWYFNRGPFSLPFHGAPGHTAEGGQDVTSVYRWFVPDPVSFRDGIVYSIEHGGQNDATADYESVAFWYGVAAIASRLTDEFRPADSADQLIHQWQVAGTADSQLLTSSFEGPLDRAMVQDAGLYHTGRASFTVSLDPDNQGVVLRRRLDAGVVSQVATVRVDGQVVGEWSSLEKNSVHRFAESDFVLPPSVT
ncbi:MAG: glycoside hydrolase family 172 protein, partial [Bacteroidota bacterium]